MAKINCEKCEKRKTCKILGGEKSHVDGDMIRIVDFVNECPEAKKLIKLRNKL